jgi:hypothetical protein
MDLPLKNTSRITLARWIFIIAALYGLPAMASWWESRLVVRPLYG